MIHTWRKELRKELVELIDYNEDDLRELQAKRECQCKQEDIGYAKGVIETCSYLMDLFNLREKNNGKTTTAKD